MAFAGAGSVVAGNGDGGRCYIRKVPNELLLGTLTYLKPEDILNFKLTCKTFRDFVAHHEDKFVQSSLFDHCDESMIPLAIALDAAAVASWKPSKLHPGLGVNLWMLHHYCEVFFRLGLQGGPALDNLNLGSVIRINAFYDASLEITRLVCLMEFLPTSGTHDSNMYLEPNQKALYHLAIIGHLLHSSPITPEVSDPAWKIFSRYISLDAKKDVEFMRFALCFLFTTDLQPEPDDVGSDLEAGLRGMMACGIERLIMPRVRQRSQQDEAGRRLSVTMQVNRCFRANLWGIDAVREHILRTLPRMIIAPKEEFEENQKQMKVATRLLAIQNEQELWWLARPVSSASPLPSLPSLPWAAAP